MGPFGGMYPYCQYPFDAPPDLPWFPRGCLYYLLGGGPTEGITLIPEQEVPYDPTNGLISPGIVMRFGP
jgi:hypothetical protein